MKKLYLFRHGETDWNKNKEAKYCEEAHNISLNELGREQAQINAKNLKDKNIEVIYASHLKRAFETASILSDLINVNVKIDKGLEEFSIYDDSVIGLTRAEIKEKLGLENYKLLTDNKDDLLDWRPLNTETKREARERIYNTIINICKNEKADIIGIASHGAILRELLRKLDFEDDSKLSNCEMIEAEYNDGKIKILKRNKVC